MDMVLNIFCILVVMSVILMPAWCIFGKSRVVEETIRVSPDQRETLRVRLECGETKRDLIASGVDPRVAEFVYNEYKDQRTRRK